MPKLALAALALAPAVLSAQAQWTLRPRDSRVRPGSPAVLELQLALAPGWHMYSLTTPKGAPIPATVKLRDNPHAAGLRVFYPAPQRSFDANFNQDVETYSGAVTFWLAAGVAPAAPAGPLTIEIETRQQLCNDKECLPPRKQVHAATLNVDPGAPAAAFAAPAGYTEFGAAPAPPAAPAAPGFASFLWVAFAAGLLAIFTPCVFPMIPITMSYFLNREGGGRAGAIVHATLFALGIVVLFTGLGLGVSAALGAAGVVQLGSNVWVNAFIAAVFFVFGLSLLGAFEITLPSGLLTRLNAASGGGGVFATLLMGLTFSLTSFACVGPIVGSLLAASVTGSLLQPALGMLAFSSGLALPFFLLAVFPGYLRRLPRGGGWMSRVKVVLGFIVLAFLLKYLLSIDQVLGWGLLTRERFLAAWVVLFALPGLYLLGFLRLEGVKPDENVGAGRLLTGIAFLAFALSLAPGMFGARLGDLDAFLPEVKNPIGGATAAGPVWLKNQYEQALAQAKAQNKLVLAAFTGYACTNCHWMKANLFPRPEVAAALGELVLLELYTDGADPASAANQRRQQEMFQTVAIPFYALIDGDGKVVAQFAGLTRDPAEFLRFLRQRPS